MYMVESGFSITIRVEDPMVHDPIMTTVWVGIQAVDQCDALDQAMRVSAVLLFARSILWEWFLSRMESSSTRHPLGD